MTDAVHVTHDAQARRFEAHVQGLRCELDYHLTGQVAWMTHTGVPRELEGRGIAAQLVRAALAWARSEGLKVKPSCSYVAAYMRRHPETQDLLAG
jgi:predicted GNAT family acetyltransferase